MSKLKCLIFLFATLFGCSLGDGTLDFRHLPSSVSFNKNALANIKSSFLSGFVSSLLGLKVNKDLPYVKSDIFSRPEAVVLIYLEGEEKLHVKPKSVISVKQDKFPEFEESFFDISSAFPNAGSVVVDSSMELTGTYEGKIDPVGTIDTNDVPDSLLTNEISNARGLIKWAKARKSSLVNGAPDEYIIRFNGLDSAKQEKHVDFDKGRSDVETLVDEITDALSKVYDGNVVVLLAQLDPFPHVRNPRKKDGPQAAPTTAAPPTHKKYTNVLWYNKNYPAAFNIIFFTSLFLSIAVLSIGVGMWFIDPGRDSIIYRMTMTRAKKD